MTGVRTRSFADLVGRLVKTDKKFAEALQREGDTSLGQAGTPACRRRKRTATREFHLIEADAVVLRAHAAGQVHPRIAKRLRVIAHLADGLGTLDAAARERVNDQTVREWRALYRKGGVAALLRPPAGRKPRLNEKQAAALAALIRARPEISYAELCGLVKRRFKIAYTESGIEAYVTRQLGFARHAGRFRG